jgi:hypothetical protein
MLLTIDEKQITKVPHRKDFDAVLDMLGEIRAEEVCVGLARIIDEREPDAERGTRAFSSSFLGSELSPWPYPLKHLYDIACEMEGDSAPDEIVEVRAGLIFGLFVWESIMDRDEKWIFYDPNLSSTDPTREITGKVYFETDL